MSCKSEINGGKEMSLMTIEERTRKQYESVFHDWRIEGGMIGRGSQGKTAVFKIVKENAGFTEIGALKIVNIYEIRLNGVDDPIKEIKQEMASVKEGAEKELAAMNRMNGHANIVSYHEFQFEEYGDDNVCGIDLLIRMDFLENIGRKEQDGTIYSEEEILKIGRDLSKALVDCHQRGILHRDIKPDNIFKNEYGYLLGDFGIAKYSEDSGLVASTMAGSYPYAAPEQFKLISPDSGDGGYDYRVDIYSLGLSLYELANDNRIPFANSTYKRPEDIQKRLSGATLPGLPSVSRKLEAVILKACAYWPEERYQSAQELLEAFEALTGGQSNADPSIWETAPASASGDGNTGEETVRETFHKAQIPRAVIFSVAAVVCAVILFAVHGKEGKKNTANEAEAATASETIEGEETGTGIEGSWIPDGGEETNLEGDSTEVIGGVGNSPAASASAELSNGEQKNSEGVEYTIRWIGEYHEGLAPIICDRIKRDENGEEAEEASCEAIIDKNGKALFLIPDKTGTRIASDFENGYMYIDTTSPSTGLQTYYLLDREGNVVSSYENEGDSSVLAFGDGYTFTELFEGGFDSIGYYYTIYGPDGEMIKQFSYPDRQITKVHYCGNGFFELRIEEHEPSSQYAYTDLYCISSDRLVRCDTSNDIRFAEGSDLVMVDISEENSGTRMIYMDKEGNLSEAVLDIETKQGKNRGYSEITEGITILQTLEGKLLAYDLLNDTYAITKDVVGLAQGSFSNGHIAVISQGKDGKSYTLIYDKGFNRIGDPVLGLTTGGICDDRIIISSGDVYDGEWNLVFNLADLGYEASADQVISYSDGVLSLDDRNKGWAYLDKGGKQLFNEINFDGVKEVSFN